MNNQSVETKNLDRECRVFCRYLIGWEPSEYVVGKYRAAHSVREKDYGHRANGFDALLVTIARVHPLAAQLADTYAVIFFKTALLRKKLVLLLAVIESCAPTYSALDRVDGQSRAVLFLRFCGAGLGFAFRLFLATVVFLPLHLLNGIAASAWPR